MRRTALGGGLDDLSRWVRFTGSHSNAVGKLNGTHVLGHGRFGIGSSMGSRASPNPKSTKRFDTMDFQKFLEDRCLNSLN